ncbi:DUF6882 domain-containing protein [Gimesia alba]|nr:DUF6882 domain-containing protein [Gimesia alba]
MNISSLLDQHYCYALDRQFLLADLIEGLDWHYDVSTGVLSFGDRYHFQAEILGTEAEADATWLWSWANEMSFFHPERIQTALKMKQWGEEADIPELTEPCLSLESIDGHTLGMIAVGEQLGQAYYRGPHAGGAVLLLIVEPQIPWSVENSLQRIITVFPQIISEREVENHQVALRHYLNHYGFEPEETGNTIIVRQQEQVVLRASFDEFHRLQELKTSIL